jgi:hypothetical protein
VIGWLSAALRSLAVGDWDTEGGDDPEPAVWDGGRYLGAQWRPAHPGRVGPAIRPIGSVVHETQMHPDSFGALVRAWERSAGRGACAHFLIGRDERQGHVQMVDAARNGNHAGGRPAHGWLLLNGRRVHPNSVLLGIEVHTAGPVRRVAGQWRAGEYRDGQWTPHGAPLDPGEIEVDPKHPDRGWHRPTEYQLRELELLLRSFETCPVMRPYPSGWGVQPNGTPPAWAPRGEIAERVVVGHTTLDPNRKSDPGPVISRWLAERFAAG